jgi:large-conductance mechanosensitive channel
VPLRLDLFSTTTLSLCNKIFVHLVLLLLNGSALSLGKREKATMTYAAVIRGIVEFFMSGIVDLLSLIFERRLLH